MYQLLGSLDLVFWLPFLLPLALLDLDFLSPTPVE